MQQSLLKRDQVERKFTSDDRYTPPEIVSAMLEFWPDGPDIDPAWSELSLIEARIVYLENGEEQDWWGSDKRYKTRVWCNPPWSQMDVFALRAYRAHHFHRSQVLFLCRLDTSTKWFGHLRRGASQLCFLGRVRYLLPDGSRMGTPSFESVLAHFGEATTRFRRVWSKLGMVVDL